MTDQISALQASVAQLREFVESLEEHQHSGPAHPTEWTISDVLSHLGSGAVIMGRRLEDALHGRDTPADVQQAVWDEWNEKSEADRARDVLIVDRAVLASIASASESERESCKISIGPMELSFIQFVGLRLNEHVVHTWDLQVAFQPDATLLPVAVPFLVDSLGLIGRFAGKPQGEPRDVFVHTFDPERHLVVSTGANGVSIESVEGAIESPDLELPAEEFVRLVYGRLGGPHSAGESASQVVALLRSVFPGL
jgi:uncharacterized protein (TIGR03083 family)